MFTESLIKIVLNLVDKYKVLCKIIKHSSE